jgi:hypothetical protein
MVEKLNLGDVDMPALNFKKKFAPLSKAARNGKRSGNHGKMAVIQNQVTPSIFTPA